MSFLRPLHDAPPMSRAFESAPLVRRTGFREYDARWWFGFPGAEPPPELNLMGMQAVGMGLGTLARKLGVTPEIVVGHDFRIYSVAVKSTLVSGLLAAGMRVHDIGLAPTPMAYFAQFELDVPCVAMVTASHNENGWTGVKMGFERPLTFGPDEMSALRDLVMEGDFDLTGGGHHRFHAGLSERYIEDLTKRPKIGRKLKVVAACGNGTAGAFAPGILSAIGCEVVPLDAELDYNFPRHNPNPEDMKMLQALSDAVNANGADAGFGFDGDGDRCGFVDNLGNVVFADKIGVMLARDLSALHGPSLFVADVKSTGLFESDPELTTLGVRTTYWKTGHSYIKRRVRDLNALAGFEKSGHFIFNSPIGRGYDDAMIAALAVIDMLDRNPERSLSDLCAGLPKTWGSPTMAAHCADEAKYDVVERVVKRFQFMKDKEREFAGGLIADLVTVNGVRVIAEDGSWGLVRASSNKPEIVVVVESPASELRMREIFGAMDAILRENPEIGAYNQTV